MSASAKERLVRSYFAAVHERGSVDELARHIHPDFINHVRGEVLRGRDRLARIIQELWAMVPRDRAVSLTFHEERGDDVIFSLVYTGTRADGSPFRMEGRMRWTIEDGLIKEARNSLDVDAEILDAVVDKAN